MIGITTVVLSLVGTAVSNSVSMSEIKDKDVLYVASVSGLVVSALFYNMLEGKKIRFALCLLFTFMFIGIIMANTYLMNYLFDNQWLITIGLIAVPLIVYGLAHLMI